MNTVEKEARRNTEMEERSETDREASEREREKASTDGEEDRRKGKASVDEDGRGELVGEKRRE